MNAKRFLSAAVQRCTAAGYLALPYVDAGFIFMFTTWAIAHLPA